MLCLRNVEYARGGRKILRSINMAFREGISYSILGPNGAGKSTIARILMGELKPTSGEVLLDSKDITELGVTERAKLGISMAWQEPARYEGITVRDYLTLGGKLSVDEDEIREVLEFVGLPYELYAGRLIDKNLSGGERKRVELASLLLLRPRYAILDEPDSGLDITAGEVIEALLKRFRKVGTTVILITHHEEIAVKTDFAYFICAGRIVRRGFSREVVDYYRKTCGRCIFGGVEYGNKDRPC
ncbi:ATP-binding cassette domain-containing protein [Thermococcus sp. AM4]|uniref:ATP-binding cassette domain-containing protein n=1 Tax=Thermococcus sp. (strain AM4) TaxID=246969 RepID=UPI0001870747|nr:ABC transporter ATP-binding protein [Thermococcus sp. AM4]EEB72974.1 IronABC transporter ATP-binding protein, protein SufC [Thermococcus sp. AM4]